MLGRLFNRKPPPPAGSTAPPAELLEAIGAVKRETTPVATDTLQRLTDPARPLAEGEAKALARHVDPAVRRALAGRGDVRPELLYFLAADAAPAVRREIAANRETPRQADLVLAGDVDAEVRSTLAVKIARLVPELSPEAHERVGDQTIEILELLARDQLPRVRQILAEELKHAKRVPHHVIKLLALDVERIVAAPIAEYSPLLSDDDLLEIIRGGVVIDAVARRAQVSERVADAVVASLDAPAVAALLGNASAQIREETLDAVIEQAQGAQVLHEPLVLRRDLSLRAIRRIASFVAASLVATLAERNKLDADTAAELTRAVKSRIDKAPAAAEAGMPDAAARAKAALDAGLIDDDWIDEALEAHDQTLLEHALALRAQLPFDTVTRIVGARSAKAITALAWKAGLTMRTAMRLQAQLAKIPGVAMLNARDGTHYPLTTAEMTWQIEYFAA